MCLVGNSNLAEAAQEEARAKVAFADPSESLARLMREELGVEVSSPALFNFIRRRWHRVSALAHKIHEAEA